MQRDKLRVGCLFFVFVGCQTVTAVKLPAKLSRLFGCLSTSFFVAVRVKLSASMSTEDCRFSIGHNGAIDEVPQLRANLQNTKCFKQM